MRIRSHLDPTLFVIFWHVDAREYDEEFRRLVRSTPAKGADLRPIFDALRRRESGIFAHERYHFWQGLRLPFLHLYATLTLRSVIVGAGSLAKIVEDWREWADLGITTATGFGRLDSPFYLAANRSGQLALGTTLLPGYEFTLKSSPKEMLECAASIFDYQTSCKVAREISDPESFRKWCKRNPAYLRVFNFLKDFLASDRLALRTVLPLINAAFHTSFPERAFAELAARIWGGSTGRDPYAAVFLAQSEPCRWHEVFQQWLTEIEYDYPLGETPTTMDLDDRKFYYLEPDRWLGAQLGQGIQHPFLGPLAAEWQRRTKEVAGLDSLLDMPGYISDKEARQFAESAEPELYIVRFFADNGSDRVFALGDGFIGPAFTHEGFSDRSADQFRGLAIDMLAVYGAFRRAANIQMTEAARTCHLSSCPHFEKNYCNCYPLIPDHFGDCGFSARMQRWIETMRGVRHG